MKMKDTSEMSKDDIHGYLSGTSDPNSKSVGEIERVLSNSEGEVGKRTLSTTRAMKKQEGISTPLEVVLSNIQRLSEGDQMLIKQHICKGSGDSVQSS